LSRRRGRVDRIDLHAHSTASDGRLAPARLVRLAADEGLSVLALTDHDTTAGVDAAAAALPAGLTLVPGTELSCVVAAGGPAGAGARSGRWISLHLLAYLFDPAEPAFAAARDRTRRSRLGRAREMVDKLAADGHPVSWEQVSRLARGTVGRPHVAAALVEAGVVGSQAAAFTPDWIGVHGRYWVGKAEIDVWDALSLVRGAGGVAVLAHAFARRGGACVDAGAIAAMARAGLAGVEVDHPDHTAADRDRLRRLAADLGLVATGSSDFHGEGRPQRLGCETTPRAAYEALAAQASGAVPVTAAPPSPPAADRPG
jgi:predicted metal-dependent phosphoesterase TrpH